MPLPPGTYTVDAYFNGTIPLNPSITLSDDYYESSSDLGSSLTITGRHNSANDHGNCHQSRLDSLYRGHMDESNSDCTFHLYRHWKRHRLLPRRIRSSAPMARLLQVAQRPIMWAIPPAQALVRSRSIRPRLPCRPACHRTPSFSMGAPLPPLVQRILAQGLQHRVVAP